MALVEAAPHQYPALHNPVHVATAVPLVLPYLPAAQFKHAAAEVCAVSALYVPAGHAAVQAAEVMALVLPYLPAAHCRQAEAAVCVVRALYVPAAQGVAAMVAAGQ